ncbi:MAG TPA: hypothetical protein VLL03_06850 [Burkholderiales bacterium]|nr:hypothetical protein [Burkholderiales bacterium]
MPIKRKDQEISMLRQEIEMLMGERQNLLRVTGAAAVFVANMDSKSLPEETYEAAEQLAEGLNALPEDTLRDALELVKTRAGPAAVKK